MWEKKTEIKTEDNWIKFPIILILRRKIDEII